MSQEQDKAFFRNYCIVLGSMAGLIVVFFIFAHLATPDSTAQDERHVAKTAKNLAPVGEVRLAGEALPADEIVEEAAEAQASNESVDPGKQVYSSLCFSCHGTGLPGIPQLGDKDAWTARIEQGIETLYKHAIVGFVGASGIPMPARGGNAALSDDDVKAAVDYMVANAE